MKKAVLLLIFMVLGGCASHAEIKMASVTKVHDSAYENKTLSYEILYSQPTPGMFSDGKQQPLTPLGKAKISVASASTLKDLPQLIFNQLPVSVKHSTKNADLTLKLEITAHHIRGPAYADYEIAKNFGKGLITLGLGSSEYDIVADFDVKYILFQNGEEVFSKAFKVKDEVDHERGQFDSINTLTEFTSQMLEKHLILTLHNFFTEAGKHVKA